MGAHTLDATRQQMRIGSSVFPLSLLFMSVHLVEEIIIECVDDIDSLFEGDKLQGTFDLAPIKTVDRINQNENEKNANN